MICKINYDIELLDFFFQQIQNCFSLTFSSNGFINHAPSQSLISHQDHSVRFIGSTTNVFKKYLTSEIKIPEDGYFLTQRCLRTRNTTSLFEDDIFPEWSSYFLAMGVIALPISIHKVFECTIKFLLKLGLDPNRIRINISSKDVDLLDCVKTLYHHYNYLIDVDGVDNVCYYRHNYGEKKICGRNFNIAIRNQKTNEFKDIGNIVLIENNGLPIAVEMGIGVSTLIARIFGLVNSIQASTISKVISFKPGFTSKLSDALSVSVIMLKENIKPGSRDKARLLRTNLFALTYLRQKLGFSLDEIRQHANRYEEIEFCENTNIGEEIIQFLENHEKYN